MVPPFFIFRSTIWRTWTHYFCKVHDEGTFCERFSDSLPSKNRVVSQASDVFSHTWVARIFSFCFVCKPFRCDPVKEGEDKTSGDIVALTSEVRVGDLICILFLVACHYDSMTRLHHLFLSKFNLFNPNTYDILVLIRPYSVKFIRFITKIKVELLSQSIFNCRFFFSKIHNSYNLPLFI